MGTINFPAEVFGAGAVDVTATTTGEGGVEGLQIPFKGPDLEHLFHRLFTAFKVFTEFFKGYSVLLFEELTQFEEDHGCVFRLRDNDSDTGSGDITFLQQGSIRGRNFPLPEDKPCTSPG